MHEPSDQLALELFATEASRPRSVDQQATPAGDQDERAVSPNREDGGERSEPVLLTTSEAASRLHVHPRTVQRLVERGQLPAIHLGTATRFDPADLAYLIVNLKRVRGAPQQTTELRPRRGRVSFAARLRSQNGEHRAAQT